MDIRRFERPLWLLLGTGLVLLAELHILVTGDWNPFLPINFHFVLLFASVHEYPSYWHSLFTFGVLPLLYVSSALAIQRGRLGRRWLLGVVVLLASASIYYYLHGYEAAMESQGAYYYYTSILLNAVGLGVAGLVAWRFSGSKEIQLSVNLWIFYLLAWCMFPWFGSIF